MPWTSEQPILKSCTTATGLPHYEHLIPGEGLLIIRIAGLAIDNGNMSTSQINCWDLCSNLPLCVGTWTWASPEDLYAETEICLHRVEQSLAMVLTSIDTSDRSSV